MPIAADPAVANRDIGLVDSGVIQNQRIRDHQIRSAARACGFGRLAHAVADDLAAAELHFVAVDGSIRFHLDDEVGISETDAIAGRRAVVIGVGVPVDFHFSFPFTRPLIP